MRRLFYLLAGLSLVACGTVASLYGRSNRSDTAHLRTGRGNYYAATALPGTIVLDWSRPAALTRRWRVWHDTAASDGSMPPPATLWNRLGFWGGFTGACTLDDGSYVATDEAMIPPWAACVPFAVLPGLAAAGWAARRRRRRLGRCLGCGYDLRRSPERCPECGVAVAVPAAG